MSIANGVKRKSRKPFVINHREQKYFDALDALIEGNGDVEYTHYRYKKLKHIGGLK